MNSSFVPGLSRLANLSFLLMVSIVIIACSEDDPVNMEPIDMCNDGILNQGEFGVDCGGPCPDCDSKMSAKINGSEWISAGNITASLDSTETMFLISGTNGSSDISFIYDNPFKSGTFNLTSAIYHVSLPGPAKTYLSSNGTITITRWNSQHKYVNGNFQFKAFEASGTGDSVTVTKGTFTTVFYQ